MSKINISQISPNILNFLKEEYIEQHGSLDGFEKDIQDWLNMYKSKREFYKENFIHTFTSLCPTTYYKENQ